MKPGMEVGLGPVHIVLDGDPAPSPLKVAQQPLSFRPMSIVANSRPSQLLLSTCFVVGYVVFYGVGSWDSAELALNRTFKIFCRS